MTDWYLRNEFKDGKQAGGRIEMVWMFGFIGGFVLLLACINFMNLSTARSEKRAKEAQDRHGTRLKEASDLVQTLDPEIRTATARLADLREEEVGIGRRREQVAKAVADRDTAQTRLDGAQRRLEDAEKRAREDVQRLMVQAEAMRDAPCTKADLWTPAATMDRVSGKYPDPVDLAGTCPLLAEARKAKVGIANVRVDQAVKDEAAMAITRLAHLPDSACRDSLLQLAHFSVERKY